MRIERIDTYSGFLNLKNTWKDLLERSKEHTIFSTWEWLSVCWKHFGTNKKLVLLLAEENGRPIGIAPLMHSVHKMLGLRQAKIEFIGTRASDYNDFILTDKKEECVKAFIDYLTNIPEKWNCIDLMDVPENSESLLYIAKMSKTMKLVHKCPYASLPKSYDIFLTGLSSNMRYDLRRDLRRLEREFKVDFVDYSEPESCIDGMNIFFELERKRWMARGLPDALFAKESRDFNLEIAESFSRKGWLGLHILKLSGEPIAAHYGFKYKAKFCSYLSGFDPEYSRYGVGNLLISNVVSQSIKEGLIEFDFMRGAEEYKDRWNTIARWNKEAILIKKGRIPNFKNWLYSEYWRQGNRLEYFLKLR